MEVVIEEDKTEPLFKKDCELLHRRGYGFCFLLTGYNHSKKLGYTIHIFNLDCAQLGLKVDDSRVSYRLSEIVNHRALTYLNSSG